MIEKVNPSHPDKVADRIAGAIVDLAYQKTQNPKIAVEVLIGHGDCHVIVETDTILADKEVKKVVDRIVGPGLALDLKVVEQDKHLNANQAEQVKCGDNGIFKGVPLTKEEKDLSGIARAIYNEVPSDGKYILSGNDLIICQSKTNEIGWLDGYNLTFNPLGYWTGGLDVDSGATNRKLGSDMAQSVTGGGIHGKDLSKADVSVNIYAFLEAQKTGKPIELCCAIGDTHVNGIPFCDIVDIADNFIYELGGFEKLAEWGLF